MSSLHRRALGGGKTTSRKARSRQPSVPTSRPHSNPSSRPHSRPGSRGNSDEDDGSLVDETNFRLAMLGHLNTYDGNSRPQSKAGSNATSNYSGDELFAHEDDHLAPGWEDDLRICVDDLGDRNWKRSNAQNREESLLYMCRIMSLKYTRDVIQRRERDILNALLRSLKAETNEKEMVLAFHALDLTTVTLQPQTIYEDASPVIKRVISDVESVAVKTAAIHSLAMVSFFSDVADDELIDNLNFLLEIVSSDGAFIDAPDEPGPVIAALEGYALLATSVDDLSDESHDAIEAFAEQLASTHAAVAIAAGECIALLYEKSYSGGGGSGSGTSEEGSDDGAEGEEEEEEEASEPESDAGSGGSSGAAPGAPQAKKYEAYRNTAELEAQLATLANVSSKQMSKKDRKTLHLNFGDILNSVRHPGHGPRYSNALRADGSGTAYGSRMAVRVARDSLMRIDRWWKLVRLHALRRVLRDGFAAHYDANPAIFEALPIVVEAKSQRMTTGQGKMRSKHFMGGTKGLLEIPT